MLSSQQVALSPRVTDGESREQATESNPPQCAVTRIYSLRLSQELLRQHPSQVTNHSRRLSAEGKQPSGNWLPGLCSLTLYVSGRFICFLFSPHWECLNRSLGQNALISLLSNGLLQSLNSRLSNYTGGSCSLHPDPPTQRLSPSLSLRLLSVWSGEAQRGDSHCMKALKIVWGSGCFCTP